MWLYGIRNWLRRKSPWRFSQILGRPKNGSPRTNSGRALGITYKIDAEAGAVFTVAEGKIGMPDIQANHNRYTADPLYTPNFAHLFDGRSAKISFSGEEARNLANWGKQNRPTAKTAIVIDKEALGWARMLVGWRGENYKIFHDLASAREWLGLPSEDDS